MKYWVDQVRMLFGAGLIYSASFLNLSIRNEANNLH